MRDERCRAMRRACVSNAPTLQEEDCRDERGVVTDGREMIRAAITGV